MIDSLAQQGRWIATTSTWLAKSVAALQANAEREHGVRRWLVGHEAGRLLAAVLDAAEALVPLLVFDDDTDEDAVERMRRQLRDTGADLRQRQLARKLADTTGRTPEEAALYRAKADGASS